MARHALVLPSPFLPATAYGGLAAALRRNGLDAEVAAPDLAAGQGAHHLVRRWTGLLADDTVVIAHSNAGYLAPLVRAAADGDHPIVFVDAALPPDSGTTRLAPAGFRAVLAGIAGDDGLLPPWTRWWPREVVDEVVAGDVDILDAACPRLPLDYVDAVVTAPPGWVKAANAYLALGATYADELDRARRHGWPQRIIDGAHLHFMHHPDVVAAHVVALATAAGRSS